MSRGDLYTTGMHPFWCDLEGCAGEEPNHVGRTSRFFVQSAEGRISMQLSRHDDTVPAGNLIGTLQMRLSIDDSYAGNVPTMVELSRDEVQQLARLAEQYVAFMDREAARGTYGMSDAEAIRADAPM